MVTIGAGHLASEALNSMLPAWPHATEAGQDRCPLESGLHTMQTAYANKGEQHEDTIAREVREETTLIGGLDGLTLDPREVLEARLFSLADLGMRAPLGAIDGFHSGNPRAGDACRWADVLIVRSSSL